MREFHSIWLALIALAFVACSSSQILVDDAYHWPDKNAGTIQSDTQSAPSAPSPSVEYINIQDTTVTVKIKR